MAKVFDLVKTEDMAGLSGRMSTSAKQDKELASQFVLSALQHFNAGRRVNALQDNVNTFISIRPRDLDVLDMAIRLLTPLKTKVDSKAKTLTVLGLPSAILKAEKPDTKEDTIKNKAAAETKKFREVLEVFIKGEEVSVPNADFFDKCNEGKAEGDASVIPETNLEGFDQCIFTFVKRIKEISTAKKAAADARIKAAKEAAGEVEHIRLDTDLLSKKKDESYKPVINAAIRDVIANITEEHLESAEAGEVKELASAVAAYEKELEKLQTKLTAAKELLAARDAELKGQAKAKAVEGFSTEELAAILAARQAA